MHAAFAGVVEERAGVLGVDAVGREVRLVHARKAGALQDVLGVHGEDEALLDDGPWCGEARVGIDDIGDRPEEHARERVVPDEELAPVNPAGWWIEVEPELRLDFDADFAVVVPDLAGWRTESLSELPETAAYTLAPDWVCEILSPSTGADDRALKMPFYAAAGVLHLWLIDPLLMTLEAYRLEGPRWVVLGVWHGVDRVRVEPFDAIELPLGRLWGGRRPKRAQP
ncbi:MAG: Uma2 family endonuclease [Myxococcales bacterium]|nr:Uma2 family endonuclease [Myxococcales bacterium]